MSTNSTDKRLLTPQSRGKLTSTHTRQRSIQMRYKIFGRRTGLRVTELALGTGNFGTGWGHGGKRGAASAIPLDAPYEALNNNRAAIAGGKSDLLDLPAIPLA